MNSRLLCLYLLLLLHWRGATADTEGRCLGDLDLSVGFRLLQVDEVLRLQHEELEEGTRHDALRLILHQLLQRQLPLSFSFPPP